MASKKILDPRFLLLSLGNPKPYTDTLHSAGHHALRSLQAALPGQPTFRKTDAFGAPCQASVGDKYTLVQSPAVMNVSGNFAHGAYKRALAREADDPDRLHMVFVHDDMEEELGVVKLRMWKSSHRGHNGIRDIKAQMNEKKYPNPKWAKISIGIGRPTSRRADAVTRWVLRPMTEGEMVTIERTAAAGVLRCLDEWTRKLEKGLKTGEELAAVRAAEAASKDRKAAARAATRAAHKAARAASRSSTPESGSDPA